MNARTFCTLTAICALLGASVSFAQNPFVDASAAVASFERQGTINFPNAFVGSDGLAGAAWLDYDNDLDLDLFVANGTGHADGLFRNNGDGTFTDVSLASGLADHLGTSGALAGDVNNDGCTDLFLTGDGVITNFAEGPSRLYINDCAGGFVDSTAAFGVPTTIGALSAAFGDIDNDGFLDLFITGVGGFLPPFAGNKTRNILLLNSGGTSFVNISAAAGIDSDLGACAVDFADHDEDGRIDIFVANCNDFVWIPTPSGPTLQLIPGPFQIFRNNGDATFTDVGPAAGVATPGFWMAVSHGDYDNDGDLDFFATNIGTTTPFTPHALYRNNGDGTYTDIAASLGIANFEFGWGTSFLDGDNDGDLDVFMVGSLPQAPFLIGGVGRGNPGRYFVNEGAGTSYTMAAQFGLASDYTSGLAVADYDGNGFEDVVILRHALPGLSGTPVLLQNTGNGNNSLTVRLSGTVSNSQGIGALVKVKADELRQVELVQAGTSMASTNSPWPTFGLGPHERANVEVTWPSGLRELFPGIAANQMVTLTEGEGVEVQGTGQFGDD